MPTECTALAIIWPRSTEAGDFESRYELWENFRPVWHWTGLPRAMSLVSMLEYPLATMVALHLARAGRLEELTGLRLPDNPRAPLVLCEGKARQLHRVLEGQAVTIVRYARSLVSDRELECLRQAGVQVDFLSGEAQEGAWR